MAGGIGVEFRGIENAKKLFSPAVVNSALSRTVTDVAKQSSTQAKRNVTDIYRVKKRDINPAFTVFGANRNQLEANLIVKSRRISLMYFDPIEKRIPGNFRGGFKPGAGVQTRRVRKYRDKDGRIRANLYSSIKKVKPTKQAKQNLGVTVKIKNDGARKLVTKYGNKAFTGQGAAGGLGGSARFRGKGAARVFVRKGKERFPIESLVTMAVPQMVGNPEVLENIVGIIGQKAPRIFEGHLRFYINRALSK